MVIGSDAVGAYFTQFFSIYYIDFVAFCDVHGYFLMVFRISTKHEITYFPWKIFPTEKKCFLSKQMKPLKLADISLGRTKQYK